VVNQAFVKKLFKPGENPLGMHIGLVDIKNSGDFEVVGIVEDTKYQNARDEPDAIVFCPNAAIGAYWPAKGSGFIPLCRAVRAAHAGHAA